MLALTPPMGWNSWNTFGADIHEDLVKETADAFIDQGLKQAGYKYVNIDDLWHADARGPDGRLTWDARKFPSGMKALGDHLHGKGLKFGTYSCAGSFTCGKKPSSFGYEDEDARTFAEWGVDYLKYDFCYKPLGIDGRKCYERMGQALRTCGRPIVFSMCEWGCMKPWLWGASEAGAHLWRTTGDIEDKWESMTRIGFELQKGLECYAGPGHWNDPDMLIVGMYGKGNVGRGGCNDEEYRLHFSLWCMLAAPLMIGCDVRSMNRATREILTAPEVVAVNQDPLGRQGYTLGQDGIRAEVWRKALADGSIAVGFFNLNDKESRILTAAWEAVGLHDRQAAVVRDLWAREDVGEFRRLFNAEVAPHACRLFKITPVR